MGKKKITPLTPALPKADELQIYRANLLNPLLEELAAANRLGSIADARASQDQVTFSGLYKLESYVAELKEALEALPHVTISANPGDVIAGVQLYHSTAPSPGVSPAPITAHIAPPSAVDPSGSYLQGTTLHSGYNFDLNVTLPETFLTEKDFQNHQYHSKRALYVAATALHLRHYGGLRFSNLYITHEANDKDKPIIVIQPSQTIDLESENGTQIDLIRNAGLVGKFVIILHFVPPIGSIAMRKLAPNRNNVKLIEKQQWCDFALSPQHEARHRDPSTPLAESIFINNIAPTPHYNHGILGDLLANSQYALHTTLFNESPLIRNVVVAAKIWLKLRGLYVENVMTEWTQCMMDQCTSVSTPITKKYQTLLSSCPKTPKVVSKKDKGSAAALLDTDIEFMALMQQSEIHYTYRQHYNQHSSGLTGAQLTHIVINLFLNRKVTIHNNLQHCMDAFFRQFLLHYPNNQDAPPAHTFPPNQLTTLNADHADNLMTSTIALPPDYDGEVTIGVLTEAQSDYNALYATVPTQTLFHSFDVILLDCNGLFNILYNINTGLWHQIQAHAVVSLKLVYGNNMGSFLSHAVTPELISANLASTLRHAHLGPLPDDDVFTALYATRIANSGQFGNTLTTLNKKLSTQDRNAIDFDDYLAQYHKLYLAEIDHLCSAGQFTGSLKTDMPNQREDDENGHKGAQIQQQLLLLQQSCPQFTQDDSFFNFDAVYDVSLPINYVPYCAILNAVLMIERNAMNSKSTKTTKTTTKTTKSATPSLCSDSRLHQELLTKLSFATTSRPMPLFVRSGDKKVTGGQLATTRVLETTYGHPQTPSQRQSDGDIIQHIPHPHMPTLPTHEAITRRIGAILNHSFTNRAFQLFVEPRLNATHTAFIWRVSVKLDPKESSRPLDRGPHAEQQLRCKEWKDWWGSTKSELRRFQDGAIQEVVCWNTSPSPYPLPNEQIPFIIAQHILPLHLFTSTIATDGSTMSNRLVVTTPTHPLGALLQTKTTQNLLNSYCDPDSSPIIPDVATLNPHQGNTYYDIAQLVDPSCPIPATLLQAFTNLSTMFREMHQFPLGIENIECTSAALRGTTPFYPQQHTFDITQPQTPESINHFFHHLTSASSSTLGSGYQSSTVNYDDPKAVCNNDVFEPINVVLTLGHSSKWPQNDLLAISRIKTAFYLKLASIIRSEYSLGDVHQNHKMSFDEAQKRVMENKNRKKNNKSAPQTDAQRDQNQQHHASGSIAAARAAAKEDDNNDGSKKLGPIYAQVTPHFVDVYLSGYVFRCRIFHANEVSLFRAQSSQASNIIAPIVLADGAFRTIEREFLYRPKHSLMMKNLTSTFPILSSTTQVLHRWFQSHFLSRNISIELTELLVASIFAQSQPFTIPTTLPAALSRIFYRLATFPFDSKPLIIPNFDFSMSQDAEAKLTHMKFKKLNETKGAIGGISSKISIICANHQSQMSYYHQEYSSDINIDQLPAIYNNFGRRTGVGVGKEDNNGQSTIFIVTPYDLESRAWTSRPATHTIYKDHLQTMLNQLESKDVVDEATANRILAILGSNTEDFENDQNDADDDEKFVRLAQFEQLNTEELKSTYRNYYASLIDRGEAPIKTQNTLMTTPALNLNDIVQLQQLTTAALFSFSALFHANTHTMSPIPPTTRQFISQQRQVGYLKEMWPIKAPIQWAFQNWLGLFKPNLAKFDAFLLLSPNAFTLDQMKRSIWLYRSKNGPDDEEERMGDESDSDSENENKNDQNTKSKSAKSDTYLHFIARMTDSSAQLNQHVKNQSASMSGDKKKKDFKLPPDLAKKLKEAEELEKLHSVQAIGPVSPASAAASSAHNTVNFVLYSGKDYVGSYLDELRASFGQLASFYTDVNGSRLIAIKFHPFFTQNQQEYSLGLIKEKIMQQVMKGKTKMLGDLRSSPDYKPNLTMVPHVLHPTQSDLHLVGLKPDQDNAGKKKIKLRPDLVDLVSQMAQVGSGLVEAAYMSYDELIQNVYF